MDDAFDLAVLDSGDPKRVIAIARRGCDLAIEPLACDLKTLDAFRLALDSAASGTGQRPTEAALLSFGKQLFALSVQSSIRSVYDRLPSTHIRLQIHSTRADLQALPWEYLQQPGATAGPDKMRSVVRLVPTIGVDVPKPLSGRKRLRLLFVYADPIDQDSVSWEDIKASIEGDFAAWSDSEWEMDTVEGASSQALFKALAAKSYDVLHFAGHGQIDAAGSGSLVFINRKTGKSDPLPAAKVGMLLKGNGLRLVVLSACSTSAGDFAKEYAVVAKTLVESGIPAVVANQFPVTNSVAAKFSGAFYQALLKTGDVDQATTAGRIFLALDPPLQTGEARFEWGTPTLYRHADGAQLLIP